jgi:hypothetical protein
MSKKKICINKQLIYLLFTGIFLIFLFSFFTYQNNQKQTTQSRASVPLSNAQKSAMAVSSFRVALNSANSIEAMRYFFYDVQIDNQPLIQYLQDKNRKPLVVNGKIAVKTNLNQLDKSTFKKNLLTLIDYYESIGKPLDEAKISIPVISLVKVATIKIGSTKLSDILSKTINTNILQASYLPQLSQKKVSVIQNIAKSYQLDKNYTQMHSLLKDLLTSTQGDKMSVEDMAVYTASLMDGKATIKDDSGRYLSKGSTDTKFALMNSMGAIAFTTNMAISMMEDNMGYTSPSTSTSSKNCYAFTASQADMDNFLKGTPLPTPPLGFVVNDCTFLLPTEAPAFRAATTQQKISYVMIEPKKLSNTNEIMTWCQSNLSAGCSLDGSVLKISNSVFGIPLVIAAADGSQYFTGLALSGTAEEATALSASTTLLSPFVVAYLVVNPGIVQDVIESDMPQEQVAKTRIRLDAYGKLLEELKAKEAEIDNARTKVQAGASEDTWVTYIDDNGKFQSSQQKPPKCKPENNSGSTPASQRIGRTGTNTLKLVAQWQKTNPAFAQTIYQSGDQMFDVLKTLPQSEINTLMSQLDIIDSGIPGANLAMIAGKLYYPSQLLNEIKRGIAPFCQEMDLSWLTQSERENVLRFLEELYKIKFP